MLVKYCRAKRMSDHRYRWVIGCSVSPIFSLSLSDGGRGEGIFRIVVSRPTDPRRSELQFVNVNDAIKRGESQPEHANSDLA